VKKLSAVRKVAVRLISAIGYLQCCDVIHADMKPEHLMLREGKHVGMHSHLDFLLINKIYWKTFNGSWHFV